MIIFNSICVFCRAFSDHRFSTDFIFVLFVIVHILEKIARIACSLTASQFSLWQNIDGAYSALEIRHFISIFVVSI